MISPIRRTKSAILPENNWLDEFEEIEDSYLRRHRKPVFNLSHWDPSAEFEADQLDGLDLPDLRDVVRYSYSYTIRQGDEVLRLLGGAVPKRRILITPSGTASVLSAITWLTRSQKLPNAF